MQIPTVWIVDLQRVMRQPSVTDQVADCRACAELVAQEFAYVGMQAQVIPSHHNPVVIASGTLRPNLPTVLITSHYDVVPAGPAEAWSSPPFAAELRETETLPAGRSGPEREFDGGARCGSPPGTRLTGNLPVNVKFMVEGDDEVETGHLGEFVTRSHLVLQADSVLLLDAGFIRDGNQSDSPWQPRFVCGGTHCDHRNKGTLFHLERSWFPGRRLPLGMGTRHA